jgi:hypothetical protein
LNADVCALPFANDSFDAVYCAHMIYHIDSVEAQDAALTETNEGCQAWRNPCSGNRQSSSAAISVSARKTTRGGHSCPQPVYQSSKAQTFASVPAHDNWQDQEETRRERKGENRR